MSAEAISPIQIPQAPSTHPLSNLADLARQAGSRYQHFAQQNNLTLVSDIGGDPLVIEADSAQITQVLHGLLSNAIKFSVPGGQVTLKVERTSDGLAHVAVTDTGVGIDPAQVARIFDPAYRPQESRPRRFGGLGIGLTLVREIITNQKGKIWVESKPGNGTRFHFTLQAVK
jgi:signal transduction histidine kinase